MINLKAAENQDVLVQFKHAKYVIASHQGNFIPVSGGSAEQPGSPVLVDKLAGHLRLQDETFILSYQNPVPGATEQMDMLLDPEDIAALWMLRKIQIVSGLVTPR